MKIIQLLAQTIDAHELGIPTVAKGGSATLDGILTTIYTVAGLIAVVVIIIAGYMYTTSAGNASAVVKAKNAILYSVIGIIVIILAFTITRFVEGKF